MFADASLGSVLYNQPPRVLEPDPLDCLLVGDPLPLLHSHGDKVGDAEGRLPRPLEQEGVILQLGVGRLESCKDSGTRHAGRALDVVVECAELVTILLEEPESVLIKYSLSLCQVHTEGGHKISNTSCFHNLSINVFEPPCRAAAMSL